jgi:hypothetical protein
MTEAELHAFAGLLVAMHEAGVAVGIEGGHLVLSQRRGQPIPAEIVTAARPVKELLRWTAISGRTRWRGCDVCQVPQLTLKKYRCAMTPGCPGSLRILLPDVRARSRRPEKETCP